MGPDGALWEYDGTDWTPHRVGQELPWAPPWIGLGAMENHSFSSGELGASALSSKMAGRLPVTEVHGALALSGTLALPLPPRTTFVMRTHTRRLPQRRPAARGGHQTA